MPCTDAALEVGYLFHDDLVNNHTKSIVVHLKRVVHVTQYLRSHIPRSATGLFGVIRLAVTGYTEIGQPKVA